ncbi:uncharacterized protein LOC142173617 [Nicotiana tabacum]|uniref:Uncharacterized protein LOC142173617 n=1 Tax=Nicotiana tabacum TaxID=4097 RepID=A0AC58TDP2_TOBAC
MREVKHYLSQNIVKLLSWNVRGPKAPNKQNEVTFPCNKEKIGLIGLLETNIKSSRIDQIANKIFGGWHYITNLESHYNGRIWILWRSDYFNVTLIERTTQVVTCEVKYIPMQVEFMVSFVYAFNTSEGKRELWNKLTQQKIRYDKPWLILGDFNAVLRVDNRCDGVLVTLAEVAEFQSCIDTCELLELPNQGQRYTWNDKHEGERIFSKIDWAFINKEWLDTIPPSTNRYLTEGISDHCPTIIEIEEAAVRVRNSFQYCNAWAEYPNFKEKVKSTWDMEIDGYKMFQVVQKMKILKKGLKELNSQHFRNIVLEVNIDREALKGAQIKMQTDPMNTELQNKEKE